MSKLQRNQNIEQTVRDIYSLFRGGGGGEGEDKTDREMKRDREVKQQMCRLDKPKLKDFINVRQSDEIKIKMQDR